MRKTILISIIIGLILGVGSISEYKDGEFQHHYIYADETCTVNKTTLTSNSATTKNVMVKQNIPTNEEINLIALVTMAEAEGECEKGKRLVIDTILNRVDSKYFPNTIHDVIYQKNQFSCMWNGRIGRCYVRNDICQLVRDELKLRTNKYVMFFNPNGYSPYGTPLFKIGNHYFSSYKG